MDPGSDVTADHLTRSDICAGRVREMCLAQSHLLDLFLGRRRVLRPNALSRLLCARRRLLRRSALLRLLRRKRLLAPLLHDFDLPNRSSGRDL